ncbi:hypothetical protein TrispH2_006704 [Trichoplax sp. H2]|nr:hypothetical protein TrispH2_006704 [Trichoplax sp. H2]|eukprot:RDD41458.1 hypothetical protein TrispH2_006704 [Trichoplax sp. H2]
MIKIFQFDSYRILVTVKVLIRNKSESSKRSSIWTATDLLAGSCSGKDQDNN